MASHRYDAAMRFFADGPSIPAELLEQLSAGNVVFFCGAGISMGAGLPDFAGLANRLVTDLGSIDALETLRAKESLDRVFNALVGEFGSAAVDAKITEILKTPRRPNLRSHKVLLDLARGSFAEPKIVTTNFDLLFERADRRLKTYVTPVLPDLDTGQRLDGIVYLHGRLSPLDQKGRAGFVITSADFGRAYLAEGWAARFVRQLRERYTVVLVGYSADDPPMRYLLEGLHSREAATYPFPIYTFVEGEQAEVEAKWLDRGVTPIAYDPLDKQHSGLWRTLEAWADAAQNPSGWQKSVLSLAQKPPNQLQAFERGQVARLVSEKAGARSFANAEPPPSAEWLCVFDPLVRFGKPSRDVWADGPEVDPLNEFRLDDDPPRLPSQPNQNLAIQGEDFLRWSPRDETFSERTRLGGWNAEWSSPLPERLNHLARWLSRVMAEPAAIWWTVGYVSLHPGLLWYLRRAIVDHGAKFGATPLQFWSAYLEAQQTGPIDQHDMRWFEFRDELKLHGWSPRTIRQLEAILRPRLEFSRPMLKSPRPPTGGWDELPLRNVADIKVRVLDRHATELDIPSTVLPQVVSILRHSLQLTAELFDETGQIWWRAPTLHPGAPGESFHGRKEQLCLWFKDLFVRLVSTAPKLAREEYFKWDATDRYFFGKFAIFCQMFPAVASPKEAASRLVTLTPEVFWNEYSQRELLFTLRARWSEFDQRDRQRLENRIIKGPPRWSDEKLGDWRRRKRLRAATMLRWLQLNQCALTLQGAAKLESLIVATEHWSEDWAKEADDSLGPRGGFIQTSTDTRGLDTAPISSVLPLAEERTEERFRELTNYRPFIGFVQSHPFRAVAALRLAAARNYYPSQFCRDVLSNWPAETSIRLRWLLAHSLSRLPNDVALDLRHYISSWVQTNFPALAKNRRTEALRLFDAYLKPYQGAAPEALSSGVGQTTVGGVVQPRSEVSFEKAINSPIGKFTQTLLSCVEKHSRSRPLPLYVRERIDRLLTLDWPAGGHVASILAQQYGLLVFYYPEWATHTLLPLFATDNPLAEAAWDGLAYDRNGLPIETLRALNEGLLRIVAGEMPWRLDEHAYERHIHRLVSLSRAFDGEKPLMSFGDVRAALALSTDSARTDALEALSFQSGKPAAWSDFVKPFISEAWPRQLRFQTGDTSRAFARIIEGAGKDFPDAVETILPFLRPVPHVDMITYSLTKEEAIGDHDYAKLYPGSTLALLDALIANDRLAVPYGLSAVLDLLLETEPKLAQDNRLRRLKGLAG